MLGDKLTLAEALQKVHKKHDSISSKSNSL